LFYRDRLRAARYAALADAEGFEQVCFAVEALGMRLVDRQEALGKYRAAILSLASTVDWRNNLVERFSGAFTRCAALYEKLRVARNDAMHTGAYARHATSAAIELCIHLEEALMANNGSDLNSAADYMVQNVVAVEEWHLVAHARQMMLMHSFSFLPIRLNGRWKLISEMSVARFLRHDRANRLAMSIIDAERIESSLVCDAVEIRPDMEISNLYDASIGHHGRLWLVTEIDGSERLLGVLTPFELM
jgi:CBS-domain-containing membrane protein